MYIMWYYVEGRPEGTPAEISNSRRRQIPYTGMKISSRFAEYRRA